MNFTNILKQILSDKVRIAIYQHLSVHPEGITGRALGTLVGTSPFKINRELRHLVAQGIITETVVGRAHLYRLQREHILVQQLILPMLDFERTCIEKLGSTLSQRLTPPPLSIIVYGSVARGEEGPQSDLDLLLVYAGAVTDPGRIAIVGDAVNEWLQRTYGNPVSFQRISITAFQHRAVQRDPLIRSIIKEGRAIAGLTLTEVLDYGRTEI